MRLFAKSVGCDHLTQAVRRVHACRLDFHASLGMWGVLQACYEGGKLRTARTMAMLHRFGGF